MFKILGYEKCGTWGRSTCRSQDTEGLFYLRAAKYSFLGECLSDTDTTLNIYQC